MVNLLDQRPAVTKNKSRRLTCSRIVEGMSGDQVVDGLPLVALLGGAHDAFVLEFERRLAAAGLPGVTLAHSRTVLRHLTTGPARASQLVEPCGMSKQAVSQQIGQLERGGYIAVRPDPADQRARLLTLTPAGEEAQRTVRRLFAEIEADWVADLGADDVAALRRVLAAAIARQGCTEAVVEDVGCG